MLGLLHSDMRVARRELKLFFLRVGLQPLLFTFILGYVMPRQGIIASGYSSLLLPGILALSRPSRECSPWPYRSSSISVGPRK